MSKPNIKTVKYKTKLGSVGNTEYWTKEDWAKHKAYCEQLEKEGRLGEEEEVSISFVPCPIWHDKVLEEKPVTFSSRIIILDLSKVDPVKLK